MTDVIAHILKRRGYVNSQQQQAFLYPSYEHHLHDPHQLAGMAAATERIKQAIEAQEAIVVYGDYDIDGLSATALLLDSLAQMGAQVSAYIPDRFDEGYGINTQALKKIHSQRVGLVITVDCGSSSREPLTWARDAGLDVIVTDHHEIDASMAGELPPAVAIINPKRSDQAYPFDGLAGVGVAFKLVQALQREYKLLPAGREKWLLDLVALGTVCDVVPLTDENRVLVAYGLSVMGKTTRLGLRALAQVAGIELEQADTHHFGFVLGPRLNAAGRLEHAQTALELLRASRKHEAQIAAKRLDALNSERRGQQDEILAEALLQADNYRDDPVLVLSHPDWSHGIVGIVAAKILERWHKPTIILQELGEEAKGSARSLGDFSMVEGLQAAAAHLHKYGGHHVAAGCTLATAEIPALRRTLNDYYRQRGFGDLRSAPEADIEISDLSVLNEATYQDVLRLAPFGMGNPSPLFALSGVEISQARAVGASGKHLKATLTDGSRQLEAIGFHLYEPFSQLKSVSTIWGELDENVYNGRRQLQLRLKEVA